MHVRVGVLALSLLFAACGSDEPGVSFSQDIAPIFEGRCTTCHHASSAIGYELDSNAFDPQRGIVGRINSWDIDHDSAYEYVVDPGKPENSSLIAKVRDLDIDTANEGEPMPKALALLSEEELTAVSDWITAGALDDETFTPVAQIFGTEITLRPSRSGRCTWCHYPGSPTGMSVLDVFDPTEGMVNVASSSGGMLVVPGDPDNSVLMNRLRGEGGAQMPLNYPRLTPAEVQKIVDWVIAGAPNN